MPLLTLALTLAVAGSPDSTWAPLRWQAANGPRDAEYLVSSVTVAEGVLSVLVRRDRALLLKQDPTIAPETHPWTRMQLDVQCARSEWRLVWTSATDDAGAWRGGQGGGPAWLPIQAGTVAQAVRARLCPTA